MKIFNFSMILLVFAVFCVLIMKEQSEKLEPIEPIPNQSPDIVSILSDFFSVDLPISSLIVNIHDKNIEISGNLTKNMLKNYLEEKNCLNFATNSALLTFPDTVFIKFYLNTQVTENSFEIIAKKIEIENFSVDTNFILYSLNLKK
ncbi:MAG: hypothetical protein R3Y12_00335 [Clostridia bacterium]